MEPSGAASSVGDEKQAEGDTAGKYQQEAMVSTTQQSDRAHEVFPNGILPPGITKDQAQKIYHKYQQMKADGVPDDDRELLKARTILQSIQQKVEVGQETAVD